MHSSVQCRSLYLSVCFFPFLHRIQNYYYRCCKCINYTHTLSHTQICAQFDCIFRGAFNGLRLTHTHLQTHSHTDFGILCHFLMLFMLHFIHLNSVYGTLPNPMRSTNSPYKNHPGKIENFTPGHSSATDKERREVCSNFLFFSEFQYLR